ncbi:hypothetical protein B5X24_HaOG215153 [Helicoverpa armigera]|nr:hypothetical protein B5X24_HaOG215153 [Helicoverpa armigera]
MAPIFIFFSVLLTMVATQPIEYELYESEFKTIIDDSEKTEVFRDVSSDLMPPLRVKRHAIVGNGCSEDRIWYMGKCRPFEQYERMIADED